MVRVEVIRQQYPAVTWRFFLVIELYGIYSYQLRLCFTLSFCLLLHLCFGEIFDKEDCFGITSLTGWLESRRTLLLKGSAMSLFLLYVIHRGRFFSFHFSYEVLYVNYVFFIYLFFKNLFYLFIYFWLCWVFVAARGLSLVAGGGYSSLRCAGCSLRGCLLLRSTGSRHVGFSSCGSWALELRLSSCGART